jgi:translation initiation factor IF-2
VSMKRGDSFNVEVDVPRFVDVALLGDASQRPAVRADPSTACRDLSTLREMLLTPVEHLVPTAPRGGTSSTEGAPPRQQQPPQFIPAHSGVPGGAPYGGHSPLVPGVGSGDAFPHFDPNPFEPRLDRPGGPLVGPGHPIFGGMPTPGPDMGPVAPGFEGPGMPHPRFDPFGPLPGRGGRGGAPGRGGRGRGRGQGGRGTQSGEPDPDMFFPPDQVSLPTCYCYHRCSLFPERFSNVPMSLPHASPCTMFSMVQFMGGDGFI